MVKPHSYERKGSDAQYIMSTTTFYQEVNISLGMTTAFQVTAKILSKVLVH